MKDILDSEEFYNLMQFYRLAPTAQQARVVKTFEDIKRFIRDNLKSEEFKNGYNQAIKDFNIKNEFGEKSL